MIVYFATSNKAKVASANQALASFGVEVHQISLDLIESRSEDSKDIALEKARQAFKQLKRPVIVEDSGFFIEALGGFPMTHVKFSLKTLGVGNILKMMRGVENRRVEWRMNLAYVSSPRDFKVFTFIEKGELSKTLRPIKREMMSDYWRLYVPKMISSNSLALCEMSDVRMNVWLNYFAKNNHYVKFGRWLKKANVLK